MLNSELLEFMASCWQKLCANGAWNANGRNKYANTICTFLYTRFAPANGRL